MAELLPDTLYPAVRAAIDTSLGTADLPDSIIALDIYAGAAVRDVLAVDPTAASRAGDELAHAQAAAVYFAAARLVAALPRVTRESGNGYTLERRPADAGDLAASLRALASAELDAYLETDAATGDMPTMFRAAPGYRGRW